MDFSAQAWHQVKHWAELELKKARDKNDAVTLSDVETAALRGEIRLLKRLLDLPNLATRGVVVDSDE